MKANTFVSYKNKEVGLVKHIINDKSLMVWFNIGGTASSTSKNDVEPIHIAKAMANTWLNNYAKDSLLERYLRIAEGVGETDDLIDERHIRENIKESVYHHEQRAR